MNRVINNFRIKYKQYISIVFSFIVFVLLQTNVSANTLKYEIYNNYEFTGISSLAEFYVEDKIQPVLYLNIKDIYKLGLQVNDIEDGISVSNDKKSVDIYFNGESVKLDGYTFNDALICISDNYFLKLDIIGKCFSDDYSGKKVGNVWRIYFDIQESESIDIQDSIVLESTEFDFEHNIYSIQLENKSYYGFENVNIYTAYYTKNGRLLDLDLNNKYTVEPKEEFTVFMPINAYFDKAGMIKIMMWDGRNVPLIDAITIKTHKFDSSLIPPENPDDREVLFTDIDVNSKFYDSIYVMHNNFENIGMFNGYEDGTYMPYNNILKSEFSYVLTGLIGINIKDININYGLIDVTDSHWSKDAVAYVVSKGFLSDKDGYFYPNEYVTLDEVLSAFLRIFGEKDFTTDMIINLAQKHNLLKGVNIEETNITRGNFALVSYNFIQEYCGYLY